ncbi:MAG: lysophospholipid acyltransferase family protein [Chloroflexota bacterium]
MICDDYYLAPHTRLLRPVIRTVFRWLFRRLGKVSISGLDHIPKDGAYLIAINHVSLFDPPFVVSFWPRAAEVVGAAEVWQRRGQGTLLRMYGVIPVHRGEIDRSLIDSMISALRSGHPLMIAPEGERSHQPGLLPAWPGVAYIAEVTGVPVLPVGVVGATEDFIELGLRGKHPPIEMRIGPPIDLPPIEGRGAERRAARQNNTNIIMSHIAAMLPLNYRGVYTDHVEAILT